MDSARRGGFAFTWELGRQLKTASQNGKTYSFKYNPDGLRTQKTDGTVTTDFYWANGNMTYQYDGTNELYFRYDESGAPVSVNINGTDYYYVKNLQGDIITLLDGQGSCVVKYTYDAWGKVLEIVDETENNIGTINPLRYRGYYYDSDLGFYYLQSRYYDPTVGRFLNADDIAYLGANGTVISHNLFAYCENNVVNNVDYTGYWWFSISVGVAGVIFDAVITWVLPYIFTAFKATKLLKWAKFSRWFRNKYNSATKSLARAIYPPNIIRIENNILSHAKSLRISRTAKAIYAKINNSLLLGFFEKNVIIFT